MRAALDRLRRDPGLALLLVALVAAAALYAPTLGRDLVNIDDPWTIQNNWIVQHPSAASVRTVVFDLDPATRFTLGAEYLPVRDLSDMADVAVWGDWYPGYHVTNLALYLAAIALWFFAFVELGVDRRVAGVAILVWALLPAHAESVAWIAERKGLLELAFGGATALGYARWRAGRPVGWLVLAAVAAVAGVWSKAITAFAVAALAGLELALPARRRSWRRSLVGLGALAAVGIAAFVPVVVVAMRTAQVGAGPHPAHPLAMVLGLHGFYLRLAAMAVPNALSYPIATAGPSAFDIALGAVGLIAVLAAVAAPRIPPVLRAAAVLWLAGWFPVSRILLPVRATIVADRYLLLPTLGAALAIAVLLEAIASPRARRALLAAIALAAAVRTLDAQANWRDSRTLWRRAVTSNPTDGEAWSMYAEALDGAGQPQQAVEAVMEGLRHTSSPRLVLREALILLEHGERARGEAKMQVAAEGGETRAMADLAVLLEQDGKRDDALAWARRATDAAPMYENGQRVHGKIALDAGRAGEALAAFDRARALHPRDPRNQLDTALALAALHRPAEARPLLEACAADAQLGARCRQALAELPP